MNEPSLWKYTHRVMAHYSPIVELLFIYYEEETRLISLGEDRHIAEYDLSERYCS